MKANRFVINDFLKYSFILGKLHTYALPKYVTKRALQIIFFSKQYLFFTFQVEQLLAGHEDSHGNINYEDFVRTVMNG